MILCLKFMGQDSILFKQIVLHDSAVLHSSAVRRILIQRPRSVVRTTVCCTRPCDICAYIHRLVLHDALEGLRLLCFFQFNFTDVAVQAFTLLSCRDLEPRR